QNASDLMAVQPSDHRGHGCAPAPDFERGERVLDTTLSPVFADAIRQPHQVVGVPCSASLLPPSPSLGWHRLKWATGGSGRGSGAISSTSPSTTLRGARAHAAIAGGC